MSLNFQTVHIIYMSHMVHIMGNIYDIQTLEKPIFAKLVHKLGECFISNTNSISFLVNFRWLCYNESGLYSIRIYLTPSQAWPSISYDFDIPSELHLGLHSSTTQISGIKFWRSSGAPNSKSCEVFKEWAILILCAMHALFPLILRFSFTKYHSQKFNFDLWIKILTMNFEYLTDILT